MQQTHRECVSRFRLQAQRYPDSSELSELVAIWLAPNWAVPKHGGIRQNASDLTRMMPLRSMYVCLKVGTKTQ